MHIMFASCAPTNALVLQVFIDVLAKLLCMRSELLPDESSSSARKKRSKHSSQSGAVYVHDGDGRRKRRVRSPQMKYNKFQMHDIKDRSPNPLLGNVSSSNSNGPVTNSAAAYQAPSHVPFIDETSSLLNLNSSLCSNCDSLHQQQQYQQQQTLTSTTPAVTPSHQLQHDHATSSFAPSAAAAPASPSALEHEVKEIRRYLRMLIWRVQQREEKTRVALEWKIVALVLDRIFFIMYLSAIIISLATLFPKTY